MWIFPPVFPRKAPNNSPKKTVRPTRIFYSDRLPSDFCRSLFLTFLCGEKCSEKSSKKTPGKVLHNLSWWTFRIFLFFLLGGESEEPERGGGRFFGENARGGAGRACAGSGGGVAKFFFSGPKCPPSYATRVEIPDTFLHIALAKWLRNFLAKSPLLGRHANHCDGKVQVFGDLLAPKCSLEGGALRCFFKPHELRWAKSRDSYRRIASESYRRDSNH